jgi:hypothetical protein
VFVGQSKFGTTPLVLPLDVPHSAVRLVYGKQTAIITVPEGTTVIRHWF